MNRTSSVFAKQKSMKSDATQKKLPATSAEWETVIADAPGRDRALTAREEAGMSNAVVVRGGCYAAVRAAVAKMRKQGRRGPQQAPIK